MRKSVFLMVVLFLFGLYAEAAEPQTAAISQDNDPTTVQSRFREIFNKNEQKNKSMRSKDIVKNKEKIRKQELLRLQKEKEIKYLNRRLEDKQKVLERLEKSKGE